MGENTCKENPMKGIPLGINFTTFIYSLSSSAMVALGMLKQKFDNGLDDEERKLLCDVVYNLRMAYVNKTK
jgi:hypothetical protein